MPSKRMNTYFKDKIMAIVTVLAIILALLGILLDFWWEMDVNSTTTINLGLWASVTCGQTSIGVTGVSTYACFQEDADNNGWIKFIRIICSFSTTLLFVGLVIQIIYLWKKSPTAKKFAVVVMFIAGLLFFIASCVTMDRIKNLSIGFSAIFSYPNKDQILRPHTLPVMFLSFTFVLSKIVAVGLIINMDFKPPPPKDPFLERSTSVQARAITSV
ncbi:uncharacterized protein LOC133175784 [Saccostrea echinata]|uniref:uncharacterized protein LOC133175784 n=1 Tax=Saccostrea echinata TaxID=191078 RepID=UPI002A8331DC|nr:uncharacterized protein LOC133175784 [Saccostrea echinata]